LRSLALVTERRPASADSPIADAGIAGLLRAKRAAVAATYSLTLVENVCALAYPALTGRAVDDLVRRDFQGLVVLVAVWLLHLVVSFVR
jgi:hypothetical protein